jgi:uncharacterized protein
VKVVNRSKGVVLAERACLARNTLERMKGLLGKEALAPGEALVITPCAAVHTFGMRYPIDVVFYDRSNRAVAAVPNLRPFRLTGWYPRAKGAIELPAGTLGSMPLDTGDQLEFYDDEP